MAYTKQNFVDGLTLSAAELNHIEDGIVAIEEELSEDWFEIADITTTEEVNSIYVNTDKNGNAFECTRIVAKMVLPSAMTSGGWGVCFGACERLWQDPSFFTNPSLDKTNRQYEIRVVPGLFTEFIANHNSSDHYGACDVTWGVRTGDSFKNLLTQFFICRDDSAAMYPVGTTLKVWGLRA